MEKTFEINSLSENVLDLLSAIQSQMNITLTNDGIPLARVVSLSSPHQVIPLAGLNPGSMVMADDFDEPLPDDFWGL